MFYFSLVVSGLFVFCCSRTFSQTEKPLGALFFYSLLVFLLGSGIFMFGSVPLLVQSILVFMAALICVRWGNRVGFLVSSLIVVGATYIVAGWFAYQEVTDLMEQYPLVSIADKLPTANDPIQPTNISVESQHYMNDLETHLAKYDPTQWYSRSHQIERLHEHTVAFFIDQPGFGVARWYHLPMRHIYDSYDEEARIPQPKASQSYTDGEKWISELLTPDDHYSLLDTHYHRLFDWGHPKRFGFFKDRHHVAGFVPHRLTEIPFTTDVGQLRSVHLIGLVVHKQPTVYISDYLLRMDDLQKVATRPPDDVETNGLQALMNGETLYAVSTKHGVRALGAIHSLTQCVDCHGGKRGDLLGAFSYTFAKVSR